MRAKSTKTYLEYRVCERNISEVEGSDVEGSEVEGSEVEGSQKFLYDSNSLGLAWGQELCRKHPCQLWSINLQQVVLNQIGSQCKE